jgi:hypothetical protein
MARAFLKNIQSSLCISPAVDSFSGSDTLQPNWLMPITETQSVCAWDYYLLHTFTGLARFGWKSQGAGPGSGKSADPTGARIFSRQLLNIIRRPEVHTVASFRSVGVLFDVRDTSVAASFVLLQFTCRERDSGKV